MSMSIPFAFAQHHGGQQAPPISFGDEQVTVNTSLFPSDFSPEENSSVDLRIRFYDSYSNTNIESTTYRVQIFSGEELVANQMFFDKDGLLEVKIQPKSICDNKELWKCTKYHGESDPIVPNALTSSSSSKPVIIGPVFDKSGEYTVKTSIIGAKNPKTQTTEDIVFETSILVPSYKRFPVDFDGNPYSMVAKGFNMSLLGIYFDEPTNSLVSEVHIDWSHYDHMDTMKSHFEFPKDFPPFEGVSEFVGKINNQKISSQNISYDEYSKKDYNTIHFIVDKNDMKRIDKTSNTINIQISPDLSSTITKKEIDFENGYKAIFSHESKDDRLYFKIVFLDKDGLIVPNIRYGYGITDPSGREDVNVGNNPNRLGIELPNGMDTGYFDLSKNGHYKIQIVLIGKDDKNFDKLLFKDILLESDSTHAKRSVLPSWIKNNAIWWSENTIDDKSFIQGIQFLIKEDIIKISKSITPTEQGSSKIPNWIKTNAQWWGQERISDSDFLKGIEFLVSQNIIDVT